MLEAGQEDLLQVNIPGKWTLSGNANYPRGYASAQEPSRRRDGASLWSAEPEIQPGHKYQQFHASGSAKVTTASHSSWFAGVQEIPQEEGWENGSSVNLLLPSHLFHGTLRLTRS